MNGVRPREILDLWRTLEDRAREYPGQDDLVLATVVSLDGSVYSRVGAMAFFAAGASPEGAIPAECLQKELYRGIEEAARDRRARLAAAVIGEDDPLLGYGFCAAGRVEFLLEPVTPALREHLRQACEALRQARGVVFEVEIEGETGRRRLYPCEHPAVRDCYREESPELVERSEGGRRRRLFRCPIHPMGKVLVFGSGPDAACLSHRLCDLGFAVFVADPRPGRLRNVNWERPRATLVEGGWREAARAAEPDAETSVILMNHGWDADVDALRGALQSSAGYVGLAGPARRAHELLAELEAEGVRPRPGVFCAPAGLDIGAETPEEIALAVAAEILAARSGRKGRRLSTRARGQAEFPLSPKAKVPGLILAAGRGRRFGAGHKLSVLLLGKPVLRHVVENALATRLDPVIVVLGCEAEAGLKLLQGIEDPRLRVVFNPLWASGKASSIEVGLREAPASAPGALSLLGDMPMVKSWLIERVLTEFMITGRLAFPVYHGPEGPRKGYPTAFPRALFGEIKALTGDDTAMAAVRRHWAEAVKVPLEDEATQLDVDRPGDVELLSERT